MLGCMMSIYLPKLQKTLVIFSEKTDLLIENKNTFVTYSDIYQKYLSSSFTNFIYTLATVQESVVAHLLFSSEIEEDTKFIKFCNLYFNKFVFHSTSSPNIYGIALNLFPKIEN